MKYFDLNDRVQKAWKNSGGASVVNGWPEWRWTCAINRNLPRKL